MKVNLILKVLQLRRADFLFQNDEPPNKKFTIGASDKR